MTTRMTSRPIYWFATATLLMLSMGAGFAMQGQPLPIGKLALQSLETASWQLRSQNPKSGSHQARALACIEQAIHEIQLATTANATQQSNALGPTGR